MGWGVHVLPIVHEVAQRRDRDGVGRRTDVRNVNLLPGL